ncbi:MAG: hypothetical protein P8N14_07905 [Sulfitobacter sp.]|nr:hypothetical protein [Sulfitobacter sp.]
MARPIPTPAQPAPASVPAAPTGHQTAARPPSRPAPQPIITDYASL